MIIGIENIIMKSNKINELDVLPYVDDEERITFGSYGTIFMDDSQRLDRYSSSSLLLLLTIIILLSLLSL